MPTGQRQAGLTEKYCNLMEKDCEWYNWSENLARSRHPKDTVSHEKKVGKQCKVAVENFCHLVDEWLQKSCDGTEKASAANVMLTQVCFFSSQI